MLIYCITNKINSKQYVGQTTSKLSQRFNEHVVIKPKSKSYIHNAIQKYGKENFEIKIIDKAANIEELNDKEKYWIKELNTLFPNGYNLTKGGKQFGKHLSSTKEKMSLAWKTRKISESTKEKMRLAKLGSKNPRFGKTLSLEERKAMSLAVKSSYVKENHPNFGKSSGMLGKNHTKETIDKIRNSNLGKTHKRRS